MSRERADTERTTLLVIDMQNDFLAEGGYYDLKERYERAGKTDDDESCAALKSRQPSVPFVLRSRVSPSNLVASVKKAVALATENGHAVIWIRAVYVVGGVCPRSVTRHPECYPCPKDHWGAALIDPLAILANEQQSIEKPHFDGFFDTELAQLLPQGSAVLIAGVETETCVLRTAQTAAIRGFRTTILSDCVGSSDRRLSTAALDIFERAFGDVKTTVEVFGDSATAR